MNNIITLQKVNKTFRKREKEFPVLKSIDLHVNQGDFVMIMGKSGSGKTTLLNTMGLLTSFDSGMYILDDKEVTHLNENEKSNIRNCSIGFIFQQFHLIDSLTIGQNVELPLLYKGKVPYRERSTKVEKYLDMVGLLNKKNQKPSELSGGQQQRIAIARALINDPPLILADEPTGSLDSITGEEIMGILKKLNQNNKTIVMVTHDEDLVRYANKVIYIQDGLIQR
ncbi:ABC transporter ATP-binding protein [Sutcliffiella horikoshii]|uniref:ABC transporter ATP-binding protein n=1 Tax=Sutcliffiella horikoshii TaxID=79883 RepID=UPI003CF84B24